MADGDHGGRAARRAGPRGPHGRAHGAQPARPPLGYRDADRALRRRRRGHRQRRSSTRGRRRRACARSRSTRSAAAAARTTAPGSTTRSCSRRTTCGIAGGIEPRGRGAARHRRCRSRSRPRRSPTSREALDAGVDRILLDNMSPAEVRRGGRARRRPRAARGVGRDHARERARLRRDRRRLHLGRRADALGALARTSRWRWSMTTDGCRDQHPRTRRSARSPRERDAVILAHNYQVPEVQDVADYVGDSLGLSRQAAATDAATILFCGVHFMAETAAILAPGEDGADPRPTRRLLARRVDRRGRQLRAWKAQHPGAVVVSYVNTTAEVKAESDYCCTSGNARAVIEAIPARPRDPVPAGHVPRPLARAGHRPQAEDLARRVPRARRASGPPTSSAGRPRRPTPSCSSIPSAAARARRWRSRTTARTSSRPRAWSTSRSARDKQTLRRRDRDRDPPPAEKEVPEQGVRRRARGRRLPVHEDDHAREGARLAPRLKYVVTVEPEIAARARGAIDRMVAHRLDA